MANISQTFSLTKREKHILKIGKGYFITENLKRAEEEKETIQLHKNQSHANSGTFFEFSISLFPFVFPFS